MISSLDWTSVERQLYDKQGHIHKLHAAYQHQFDERNNELPMHPDLVIITGPEGVGKTSLASSLTLHNEESSGHDNTTICCGSFEPPKSIVLTGNNHFRTSFGPFVAALTVMINRILQSSDRGTIQSFRTILQRQFDHSETQVLEESIPDLRKITRSESSNDENCRWIGLNGLDAEKRYVHILAKLIQASSDALHEIPLVFLLENWQWADPYSLDLIKVLASLKMSGLLLICTARDGLEKSEGDESLILSTLLADLKLCGGATITEIELKILLLDDVSELLSGLLHTTVDKVQPLSIMVHHQTGGNLFFISELLALLQDEGILYVDSEDQWCWEADRISPTLWENRPVKDIMASRIQKFTEFEQKLLKTASCLGCKIHEILLEEVVFPNSSVRPALEMAVEKGIITFDNTAESGRFCHQRIQEAVYSLISQEDRVRMHLDIGLRLWIWLPPLQLEDHLFTVVNQIVQGLHLLDDPVEKEELAKLMLRTGRKAALQSSFSQAAAYFDIGIRLLRKKHWKHQYDTSLALYNAAVEVEYYNGNIERMESLLLAIFKHGKSLNDMLQAHFTQIYALHSRGDMRLAFEKGMEVLKLLGVTFPVNPGKMRGACAWAKCRWLLQDHNDDSILNLPTMTDDRNLVVMRILALTTTGAAVTNDAFVPLLVKRMVQTTIRFGISETSCYTFAVLGLCMGRRGQTKDESRFSRLACKLSAKLNAQEWQCRVALLIYNSGQHKLKDQIQPLQSAHRAGLVAGDVQASVVCASRLCRAYFFASHTLAQMVQVLEDYKSVCVRFSQQDVAVMLTHQLQVCLNFMGRSTDPLVLTGDAMNEDQAIEDLQGRHMVTLAWLLIMKHMLAVYFNDLAAAVKLSAELGTMKTGAIMPVVLRIHLFMEGLTAATLSRNCSQQSLRARQILTKLKSCPHGHPQDFENKIFLIEAEMAATRDDWAEAQFKFQQSIEAAERQGFLHEQALARETWGRRWIERGDSEKARECLQSAASVYRRWGSHAKMNQLEKLMSSRLRGQ